MQSLPTILVIAVAALLVTAGIGLARHEIHSPRNGRRGVRGFVSDSLDGDRPHAHVAAVLVVAGALIYCRLLVG
jgi:hypothetical protein